MDLLEEELKTTINESIFMHLKKCDLKNYI